MLELSRSYEFAEADEMRVLLYSHDSYGLGHFRRTSSIAHAIARAHPGASCLCVTGSPRPDLFPLPEGADYVKLPSVTKDERGDYVSANLRRNLDGVVHLRGQTVRAAARSFRPDVILVDHSPLGVGGELLPMLEEQSRRSGVEIVLGLRDILDEPERARQEFAHPERLHAMENFYDHIVVYGQPEICDLGREYRLPASLAARIHYVGIVCGIVDEAVPLRSVAGRERPHVLATAGGGGDGMSLLAPTVTALRRLADEDELSATIIGGPFLERSSTEHLRRECQRSTRLRYVESTPNLYRLLRRSELAITMGGYNSIYEALGAGVQILAHPRIEPRREQFDRVRRLSELGLVNALDDEDLNDATRMMNRIRQGLAAAPERRTGILNFDGAVRTATLFGELLDGAASRGRASRNGSCAP